MLTTKMIHWTEAVIPLVAGAVLAGCAGQQQRAAQSGPAAGDSGGNLTTAQAPAPLAGSWVLRDESGMRMAPRLELSFDSVTATTFRVRVAFLMSGNVGIDPERFQPTRGELEPEGLLRFKVRMRQQADPLGDLMGTLQQDTIRLQTFHWAGEDQTVGGSRWVLVRQRQ